MESGLRAAREVDAAREPDRPVILALPSDGRSMGGTSRDGAHGFHDFFD